jgi:hypothetical protein
VQRPRPHVFRLIHVHLPGPPRTLAAEQPTSGGA